MIPAFKKYFYPYMTLLSDKAPHHIREIRSYIAQCLNLTTEDLREKTKGGKNRHEGHCSWTTTYLKKMKLIEMESSSNYKITDKGYEVYQEQGENFSLDTIRDLAGFCDIQKATNRDKGFWVPGHYTSSGRYIAGYVSSWEYAGKQRRFTKEELNQYLEEKKQKKEKKCIIS